MKRIGIICLIPMVLVILISILLYIPPFQNFAVRLATEYASETTGMNIRIGQIRLSFPLNLTIRDVKVITPPDTLLSLESFQVNIRPLPLLKKEVLVDAIDLRGSLSETLTQQLQQLSETNARRMTEVRGTLEQQLAQLQAANTAKLDEMRQTVDEKLQSTLQARLGESFKQVADRLEQVHKGLGEMQTLAQGVGDLKHLLTNVKTRGMFGEAQLGALLEQVFAPEQYAAQVCTRPGSRNAVDFAIKLPGRGAADSGAASAVWLPIDAKFPNEDYERLLDAQQRADAVGAEAAAKGLEARIRLEARGMADKYVEPPHTTDFAILFLPTEGLYAEVLRRPGLMEALQRDHRVTLAGPTTLLAMLNSLQMGFRTLALEKRSSEVWQVLGAVKTEFGKFGGMLDKVKSQTQTVLNTLDQAQTRTNMMNRALRKVEALPDDEAQALLPGVQAGEDGADG